MPDYEALNSAINADEYARKIATEEAVVERISRMSLEEQENAFASALAGMPVNYAKPTHPMPPAPPALNFYRAAELYGKRLEHTRMIVERMIPCGLTVLAGSPKRGKSWLALSLAVAVSSGAEFLGQRTTQGSVLYLDLESRQYRVQDRLSRLVLGPAPEGLYIAHQAEPLGPRFYQQMEGWMQGAKDPALIIVDTLGRVKPSGRRNENAYESDTRQYGALQSWAAEHKLAILVVHHLRKVKDSDDWFDKVNGSNGLVGAADAVIGLGGKRGEAISKLMVSGRDIDGDYNMAIRFDGGRWILESADSEQYEQEHEYMNDSLVRGIFTFMYARHEWQGTATQLLDDIVDFTQEPLDCGGTAGVGKCLRKFSKMLYERDGILFGYKRTGQRRLLFLKNTRIPAAETLLDEEAKPDVDT